LLGLDVMRVSIHGRYAASLGPGEKTIAQSRVRTARSSRTHSQSTLPGGTPLRSNRGPLLAHGSGQTSPFSRVGAGHALRDLLDGVHPPCLRERNHQCRRGYRRTDADMLWFDFMTRIAKTGNASGGAPTQNPGSASPSGTRIRLWAVCTFVTTVVRASESATKAIDQLCWACRGVLTKAD